MKKTGNHENQMKYKHFNQLIFKPFKQKKNENN